MGAILDTGAARASARTSMMPFRLPAPARFALPLILLFAQIETPDASAAAIWTNTTSGLWRDSVNSLNIWAAPNFTNALLLSDLGVNKTLLVSNSTLDVRMRGALQVANSSLVV